MQTLKRPPLPPRIAPPKPPPGYRARPTATELQARAEQTAIAVAEANQAIAINRGISEFYRAVELTAWSSYYLRLRLSARTPILPGIAASQCYPFGILKTQNPGGIWSTVNLGARRSAAQVLRASYEKHPGRNRDFTGGGET